MLDFQKDKVRVSTPLAERMRPKVLSEFVGQTHLTGPTGLVRKIIESSKLPSLVLWGPPGSGKTTLALILQRYFNYPKASFSAVTTSIKEVKVFMHQAGERWQTQKIPTIVFMDEIHRFNRAQQEAFLPYLESGAVILLGTTTENPSFYLVAPLLSRCKVLKLDPLSPKEIKILLKKALIQGFENPIKFEDKLLDIIAQSAQGDARIALNLLEIVLETTKGKISGEDIKEILGEMSLRYDKSREEHYNLISAFIKSMRGSDPDAAIYWLERMLTAGEDPLFILRRMLIFASEDIGNADPQALQVAVAAFHAFQAVGMPEGVLNLVQAAIYLACAPKSNAVLKAHKLVQEDIKKFGSLPVPLHLCNAPTKLMASLGYGKGYKYPHNYPDGYVKQQYMPGQLKQKQYYFPTQRGMEKQIRLWLKRIKQGGDK